MSETVLGEYGIKASKMAPSQMQAVEHMAAEYATIRARVAELEAQLATARAEERERIDGILAFRKQTAEVRHLRALITPTPTPTPEANRE